MGQERSRGAAFVAGLLAALAAIAPVAATAVESSHERVLGLPQGQSILFAFKAEAGSLVPRDGKARFKLVLRSLDDRGLWFADRPDRDSGTVATKGFFGKWGRLGFADDPPNAALVLEDAKASEDAIALELGTPRFDRRSATVRLTARALPGPSRGLAHLVEELDEGIDRDFGASALFVDNATGGDGCIIGAIDWFATPPARTYDGKEFPRALPANGATLDISQNTQYEELFEVIGHKFGGDGGAKFALPSVEPLVPGVYPLICWDGYFPSPSNPQKPQCLVGDVEMLSGEFVPNGYVAANGGTLPIKDYSYLWAKLGTRFGGDGTTTFGVPDLPAPAGLQNAICAVGDFWDSSYQPAGDQCVLSGVDLFTTTDLPPSQLRADGSPVQIRDNTALFSLLGVVFGGNGQQNFNLPNIASPPGTTWGVCGAGVYPELYD